MNAYVVHTWIVDLKEGLVRYVVDKSEDAVAARQASKQFSRKFWTQKLLESRVSGCCASKLTFFTFQDVQRIEVSLAGVSDASGSRKSRSEGYRTENDGDSDGVGWWVKRK